ncbi:MAG: hypothetical protein KBC35_03200 [Candidatus Pacebacteria bacterium]|nr:hypothetical protein [Candidatus Paceibacterota bacterium]
MNNFKNSGPGGLRNRPEYVGGRPSSDADYSTKKKFGGKPAFGSNRGGDRGDRGGRGHGERGGDRGGRGGFGGNRGGERREVEMFKTTCTACGKPAEVPFRPDGSKPVLCRDCFASNKSDDHGGFGGRDRSSNDRGGRDSRPERNFESPRSDRGSSPDYKALLTQVSTLEAKINEILSILKTTSVPVATPAAEVAMEVAEVSVKEKKPNKEVAKKAVKKTAEKMAEKKVAKKVVKKAAKKVVKK